MNFVHIVIIINQEMRIFYRVVLIIFVGYINGLSKMHICIIVRPTSWPNFEMSYGRQHSF